MLASQHVRLTLCSSSSSFLSVCRRSSRLATRISFAPNSANCFAAALQAAAPGRSLLLRALSFLGIVEEKSEPYENLALDSHLPIPDEAPETQLTTCQSIPYYLLTFKGQ